MHKKIAAIIIFVLAPFGSQIVLTTFTMFPALYIAQSFIPSECEGISGESLCGFSSYLMIMLILNSITGYIITSFFINFLVSESKNNIKIIILLLLAFYFLLFVVFVLKSQNLLVDSYFQ